MIKDMYKHEYYYPTKIGECTFGIASHKEEDKYGNFKWVLQRKYQKIPPKYEIIHLPSHKSLMDQCTYVQPGDNLFITLTGFKELPQYETTMKLYEVYWTPKSLVNPDQYCI